MRFGRLSVVIADAALSTGCLVDIEEVSDPGPAFAEARAEAARVAVQRTEAVAVGAW